MSRLSAAKAVGFHYYRSGKDCPQKHVDPLRYTSTGGCKVCNDSKFKERKEAKKKIQEEQEVKAERAQYGKTYTGAIRWKDKRPEHVIYDDVVITDQEKDVADFNDMIERIERIRGW